jgi:hypothetical protein
MKRRGQVEMNETLLVLFIIVILIIVGMVVYFRFSLAKIESIGGQLSEQESTVLLASASTLAEFRCSHRDCVDTSKFLPFRTTVHTHVFFYTAALGYKKIAFYQVYPAVDDVPCTLELYAQDEYPDTCSSWVVYDRQPTPLKQAITTSTPVSLYFPEVGEYRIGRLEVTSYA